MKTFTIYMALFFSVSMVTSCGGSDSDDIVVDSRIVPTGEIYATFQVVDDGSEDIYVEAQLTIELPPRENQQDSFIGLRKGDELWFSTGENIDEIDFSGNVFENFRDLSDTQANFLSIRSSRSAYSFLFGRSIFSDFGKSYSAELPASDSTEYRVVFLRRDSQDAPGSIIMMPLPFDITSPRASSRYSRSQDDIVVTWSNIDDSSDIEVESNINCPNGSTHEVSEFVEVDTGTLTIPAGTLDMPELIGQCTVTLNVRRTRAGAFDSRFIGGAVNGHQVRRLVFITES